MNLRRHRLKTFEALTNNTDGDSEMNSSNFIEDVNNLKRSFTGETKEDSFNDPSYYSGTKETRDRFLSY